MADAQVSKTCGALNLMWVRLPPSAQLRECGSGFYAKIILFNSSAFSGVTFDPSSETKL